MIVAEAEPSRLPARVWPLTAACQRLAKSKAPVDPAVLGCARSVSLIWGDRLVETWMHHLAENGFVRPSGRGMHACWEIDPVWQDGWRVIVEALDADERATFREAAQVLTSCLYMGKNLAGRFQRRLSVSVGASRESPPAARAVPQALRPPPSSAHGPNGDAELFSVPCTRPGHLGIVVFDRPLPVDEASREKSFQHSVGSLVAPVHGSVACPLSDEAE
jgi:hypothetical protein